MKGGHNLVRQFLEEGKVDQIDVEVDDVELVLPKTSSYSIDRWAAKSD